MYEKKLSPNSVKWLQHLAALLYLLPMIYSITLMFGFKPFEYASVQEYCKYMGYIHLTDAVILIFEILALFIFLRLACNRMNSVAVTCGAIWNILFCILHATILYFWFSASSSISSVDDLTELFVMNTLQPVYWLICIVDSFVWVYIFSILLRSGSLSLSSRSWIVLLAATQVAGIVLWTLNPLLFLAAPSKLLTAGTQTMLFTQSTLFQVFRFIYIILIAIGYIKLCHCEAFTGNYDASPAPRGAFSPFNKYMLALVIGGVVTLGFLWLLYHNAEIFVNL